MTSDFALYKLPNSTVFELQTGLFSPVELENIKHPTFIINTWEKNELFYLQNASKSTVTISQIENLLPNLLPITTDESNTKNNYFDYHKKCIEAIENNEIDKVVTAIQEIITINYSASYISKILSFISNAYSQCFVSLIYSHKLGLWIGASPEKFIEKNNNIYSTISLAGTKKIIDNFEEKEKKEQQIVSDYIAETIHKNNGQILFTANKINNSMQAVKHLQTNFTFTLPLKNQSNFISEFHPTPAVGGSPQIEAINFIKKHEGINRKLYAGFIGIFDAEHINLFVNIRCAQIHGNAVTLYAGCGINKGSEAESEWLELQEKIALLKQFFK